MKKIILLLLCGVLLCAVLTGCGSNSGKKSPQQAIEDAYDDAEFTVSFMSEGLNDPIESITYTASNMPKLPTPEKIGYIFSGWYLDSEYTIPYIDGILYLYMRDVTLYAKWEKESFTNNGTYDVEYEAEILADTIVKGAKTDEYGGYKDFTQSLIADEICLEKSDGKLLLKLQYDTECTIPMFQSSGEVYSVKISSKTGTSVYVEETIDSLADPIKTVFINLSDFDLNDTLYLDIQTINWENDELDDAQRLETLTRYTVAIRFTKIIGFAASYVDTETPLEEGYYLVKSYYRKENNGTTMADSFNPVYSYLYSDGNEHYTLIKQNIPYAGLTSLSSLKLENTAENYYHRLMSLIPIQLYYEITNAPVGNDEVESDYYPETYGGRYYGNYAMEYHAGTGKFYNIYDLGNNLTSSYMLMGAVTGFMEVAGGMGYVNLILELDYEHMIKLAEVDYQALEGDSYQYQSDMQYYPGAAKDLSDKDLCYDTMLDGGLSTDLVNFFYSAASKAQYSSRITVTPTVGTNANTVADSRYMMAHFDVHTQIYGYDASSDEVLLADTMTVQSMGGSGMRRTKEIKIGKSCTLGETVKLAELYAEKCDATTAFSSVTYAVYGMKNGKVDYEDKISLKSSVLTFEKNVAVVFEVQDDDGIRRTVVELVQYEEPTVKIESTVDYPYDSDAAYAVGDIVVFPNVTYRWLGKSGKFIDTYYADETATEIQHSIDVTSVVIFENVNGKYVSFQYGNYNQTEFTVPSEKFIVMYELTNEYGERYYYSVPFVCSSRLEYTVTDSNGHVIDNGGVHYGSEGVRVAISTITQSERLTEQTYSEQLSRKYQLTIGEFTKSYELVEYTLYTDLLNEERVAVTDNESTVSETLWEKINGSSYAVLELVYKFGSDRINVTYYYNLNFSGKTNSEMLSYSDYFVGHQYAFTTPELYDKFGNLVASGFASSGSRYALLTKDYFQYRLNFTQAGDYTITQEYRVNLITLKFKQDFHVWNGNVDVTITYVTDSKHPFDDGTLERTVTYNLVESIYAMKKSGFSANISMSDILYGWAKKEGSYDCAIRSGVVFDDFISEFNSRAITLYAIWDPGLTVTVNKGDGNSYTKIYYLNDRGYYQMAKADFSAVVPSGYQLAGWESGLFGGVSNSMYMTVRPTTIDWDDSDLFLITPVFKKEITVKYSVDSTYTNAFFRNETVLEGECVSVTSAKMNPGCKVAGYQFVGWYVLGDATQTVIDFETYVITEETTFVAKFAPISGD